MAPHPDRVLLGPGPSNPHPAVIEALVRPTLGHLDPVFLELLDETNDRLRTVFGTASALTFPVSGTGSAGMEAALVNLVRPDDPVVVGVNGLFGARIADAAGRLGAQVITVEAPWGEALDPEAVAAAHPSPALIAVVHAETSTGVRNDVAAVAARKGEALVLADCVTSVGGIPVAVDEWGVDVAFAGTQKCLGVPPGLAPLTVSARALERRVPDPPSWYLDLGMLARYVTEGGPRAYHHTAPTTMVAALHAGLGAVLDEGLDAAIERHRRCGERLQEGLEKLGLELFAAPGCRLPQLTSVWVPQDRLPNGTDEAALRRVLLDRYGIEIGGGLGPVAGRVWRIGLMGHAAQERNVTLLLGALAELLAA